MRHRVSIKLYAELGLPDYSSIKETRKAYRKLCLENHPDRGGDIDRMKRINAAYDFLIRYKGSYDRELRRYHNMKKGIRIRVGINGFTTTGSTDGSTWTYHF